jgi:hypothetical protein
MLSTRSGPALRALRDAWWMWVLLGVAVVLYGAGLDVRLRCRLHDGCHWWTRDRFFDLDSLTGLPRLFITGLFVAVAVLAWRARSRSGGPAATWWTAIAVIGGALAVLKVVSAHSDAKASNAVLTLAVGALLSVVALGMLLRTARRWSVPAGPPVVVALAVYAFAALGLDAVTGLVAGIQGTTGVVADSVATFIEEFGEALGALFVLAMVWCWLPSRDRLPAVARRTRT